MILGPAGGVGDCTASLICCNLIVPRSVDSFSRTSTRCSTVSYPFNSTRSGYLPGLSWLKVAGLSCCLLSSVIVAPAGVVFTIANPSAGGAIVGAGGCVAGGAGASCAGAGVDLFADGLCIFCTNYHPPAAGKEGA